MINLFSTSPSRKTGIVPINLVLKTNDRREYDQNAIIFGFEQLRDYLSADTDLYDKIVITSILQSGLDQSTISFTNLIPYDDFQKVYNKTLSKLENNGNLENFYQLGMFERNAWSMPNGPVAFLKEKNVMTRRGLLRNIGMAFLPKTVQARINARVIPQVSEVPTKMRMANNEYILYTGAMRVIQELRKEMAARGDFFFMNRGLFRQVKVKGEPYIYSSTNQRTKVTYDNVIYKHINALGDGFRAREYYKEARLSALDNGTLPAIEKRDEDIIAAFEVSSNPNTGARLPLGARKWAVQGDKFIAFNPYHIYNR